LGYWRVIREMTHWPTGVNLGEVTMSSEEAHIKPSPHVYTYIYTHIYTCTIHRHNTRVIRVIRVIRVSRMFVVYIHTFPWVVRAHEPNSFASNCFSLTPLNDVISPYPWVHYWLSFELLYIHTYIHRFYWVHRVIIYRVIIYIGLFGFTYLMIFAFKTSCSILIRPPGYNRVLTRRY